MDENEFFRMATLDICGSLQIEQAMHNCVCTIKNLIPVDRMFLLIYDPDLAAMRTLAMGTIEKGGKLNWLTPLARAARDKVRENTNRDLADAIIIDPPEENPVAREMMRFAGITEQ
jgi:formate hydrogenlyase transcriptional activator